MGSNVWGIPRGTKDASLFSSSLPVFPRENLTFTGSENSGKSTEESLPNLDHLRLEDELQDPFGNLLPDDEDDLLAGVMDDFDLNDLLGELEDLDNDDLFGSGGGLEMDFDALENLNPVMPNGFGNHALINSVGAVVGEHPYGEHPSRTLFVRNINSNVEDSELRSLFEQYGDIRTLYTACKHRGFVMISYYDIRAARTAMRALQNKPLRRRKLDIHFSIPKDNPSEKDVNQGTLVVFNLEASVSNEELLNIFGAYGEIKEIRETPHKRHHKFIEFYDVRGAEAALGALNRREIGGKRIKLEPSRPGGARRNLMQQLTQELDLDETRSFRHQLGSSPVANSPPGNWAQFGSPVDHNSLHSLSRSPVTNHMPGLASVLPSPTKIAPIGKINRVNGFSSSGSGSVMGSVYPHSQSFPDQEFGSSPGTLSGPQFLWGSPTPYSERASPSVWPKSTIGQPLASTGREHGFAYTNRYGSLVDPHHVGSAPSFMGPSPDTPFMGPSSFGNMGSGHSNGSYTMNAGPRSGYRMMSLPRPVFLGNGSYQCPASFGGEGFDRRRVETNGNGTQVDSKQQFQLDLDKIINGEDTRTTLMLKNIPNKYTSKMLLAAIDEGHSGTYDFLYLPIDFKNKCNVGYAFINMLSPAHIIPFYNAFNGKKWEKFNSEKVASLAYARIQGKNSLVTHFQNSSLMNEDKRCRPILFHSEGEEASVEENLLSGNLNVCIRQPDGSYSKDLLESPKGRSKDGTS